MAVAADIIAKAKAAAAKIDADVFVFNGTLVGAADLNFIELIHSAKSRDKALLVLTTNGGDPDAAYKIARYFQDKYKSFTVLIAGRCKSAGTLLAVGATELVFMPYGELGPLDIQLAKVDRFDRLQSGLTIQDSLQTLEDRATQKFMTMVRTYIASNQGLLSFPTAAKAASEFVTQLYAPVFGRIDPEEIGVRARSMRIAMDYGQRLAVKSGNLKTPTALLMLAEKYPSHSFVIDKQEAEGLFTRVRDASPTERDLVSALLEGMRDLKVPRTRKLVSVSYLRRHRPRLSRRRERRQNVQNPTAAEVQKMVAEILKKQLERPSLRPHPLDESEMSEPSPSMAEAAMAALPLELERAE